MEIDKIFNNIITNAVAYWTGKNEKEVGAMDVAKVFTASVFWPITFPIWLVRREIQNDELISGLKEGEISFPLHCVTEEIQDPIPDPIRSFAFMPELGFKGFHYEYELGGTGVSRDAQIMIELRTNPDPTAKFEVVKYRIKNLETREVKEDKVTMWEDYTDNRQRFYRVFIEVPREFYSDGNIKMVMEVEGVAEFTEQFNDLDPQPTILTFVPAVIEKGQLFYFSL